MRQQTGQRQTLKAEMVPSMTDGKQPVDLEHLRRYTLGDRALEREVLDLFFGQLPETISGLAKADSPDGWRRAAHTLKGSGRAVGAWRIAELAEAAERAGFAKAGVAKTIAAIRAAVGEAETFIAAQYGDCGSKLSA